MKVNWIKLGIAGVLISFSFASCVFDQEGEIIDGIIDGVEDVEEAYFSLNIGTYSGVTSKAGGEETGIDIENYVKNVRVLLYDPVEMTVKYRFDLNATNTDGDTAFSGSDVLSGSSADALTFIMKAKKVVKQDYKMLVLVNPSSSLMSITEEEGSESIFRQAVTRNNLADFIGVNDGVYNSANNYSFFMSNFKDLEEIDKDYHLQPTAEQAENRARLIMVDRAVAKVMLTSSDVETPQTNGARLANVYWKLDVTNKKSYWMRRWAPLATGANETYAYQNRYNMYAEDPNFDNISNDRYTAGLGSAKGTLSNEFNYITNESAITTPSGTNSWEYALENTMAADEQWEDVTTRVLIKANYIPNGFSAGQSYFIFSGIAFTEQQMKDYANGVNNPDEYPGLRQAINEVPATYSLTNPTASFSAGKIRYYKNGICFYYVPIRHFDDTQASDFMDYGRYGIVRNNVYKINLNELPSVGSPNIPDPEGPDDKEQAWISAKIQIMEWYVRSNSAKPQK